MIAAEPAKTISCAKGRFKAPMLTEKITKIRLPRSTDQLTSVFSRMVSPVGVAMPRSEKSLADLTARGDEIPGQQDPEHRYRRDDQSIEVDIGIEFKALDFA